MCILNCSYNCPLYRLGSALAAEQMLQTVGDNLFICGPVVYSAGKQEPWRTVSKWCARQQFPLWPLSRPDWPTVTTVSLGPSHLFHCGEVIKGFSKLWEPWWVLLFIIRSLLQNNLECNLFLRLNTNRGYEYRKWTRLWVNNQLSESDQVAERKNFIEINNNQKCKFSNNLFDSVSQVLKTKFGGFSVGYTSFNILDFENTHQCQNTLNSKFTY